MQTTTRAHPRGRETLVQKTRRWPSRRRVSPISPISVHATNNDLLEKAKRGAVAVSLAATLFFLEPFGTGDAEARERLVRAPLAQTPELQDTQRVMIEAWNLIRTTYVDPSFNHVDWDNELAVRLRSVATSESVEEGQRQLKDLVSDLGDVYTRWMPANTYQEFLTDSINSEVQGVGLLIASDPVSGKHLVLSPIQGGPAALAGIQSGDEIVRVNGAVLESSEDVGKALRGKQGTNVELEIARQVPGEVGMSGRPTEDARLERKKYRLKRQRVSMSPVGIEIDRRAPARPDSLTRATRFARSPGVCHGLTHRRRPHGRVHQSAPVQQGVVRGHVQGHQPAGHGGVRGFVLTSTVVRAHCLSHSRYALRPFAAGYILDLRNNPGGLVTSALDVAGLFLDSSAHPTIFSVSGRGTAGHGNLQDVKLEGDAHALSEAPLTVLVNSQSASASEILAGALKDNKRAAVIGDSKTFGKARIQSVFELADGSGLFVTVAKYLTPAGTDINLTGITPSMPCAMSPGGRRNFHSSIPVAPGLVGGDASVLQELETDPCVLKALDVDLAASRRAGGPVPTQLQ